MSQIKPLRCFVVGCNNAAVPNSSPPHPPHCIFCMSLLVNTPDSDKQLVRRELRAGTVFPIDMIPTQCPSLPTP